MTKDGKRCQIHVQTTHQSKQLGTAYLDIKPFDDSVTLWACALKANDPDADDKYRQALLDVLPVVQAAIREVTNEPV
jgi:hypothetical protein